VGIYGRVDIMSGKSSKSGSQLFIVDNSDKEWKVRRYLRDWTELASSMDIATGYFEIGALLMALAMIHKMIHKKTMPDKVNSREAG